MDIEERDSLDNVMTGSKQAQDDDPIQPSIRFTTQGFTGRSLNTSFAAAYFPDINLSILKSDGTRTSKLVPPTVAVLGAYATNDSIGQSWFAPAGNTRGVIENATSTELGFLERPNLDTLYSADINPINTSINNGVVIQGQKTLLKALSALDRVNVRRLLITVRRAVRNIANTLIFEPNRPETLNKFRSLVNPILESLKSQQGVSRYKVVIDETTTTQADIENNTIRGKIYLQPVRVAEFIALDFNINNQIID
jgi:phage tail sheath protein FI